MGMRGARDRMGCRMAAGILLAVLCGQAHAQTQVQNSALASLPDGTDIAEGNNSDSVEVVVYAVALAKSADPVDGTPVAVGATINYTISATVSGGATTTEPVAVTDTLGPGLEFVTPLPPECVANGSVLEC